jgi:hypothetical protein
MRGCRRFAKARSGYILCHNNNILPSPTVKGKPGKFSFGTFCLEKKPALIHVWVLGLETKRQTQRLK